MAFREHHEAARIPRGSGRRVAAPRAVRAAAQQKIPRIGIIDDGPIWQPFREALREAGYIEGQTIAFETRRADGDPARLAAAAAELAALPVDMIATYGTPASRAAKAATSTIPIVMISIGDPVRAGLVQSLAHPGGNITGNTILSPDLRRNGCNSSRRSSRRPRAWRCFGIPTTFPTP